LPRALLIAGSPGELRAALLEDGVPVELWSLADWARSQVGEIHLARVVRLLPALPGAFVTLGDGREALLSEEDAVDLAPAETRAGGIARWLHEGERILVQVARDARGGKAPGVTARIALAGRALDLLPTRDGVRFARGMGATARAEFATALPGTPGLRLRVPAAVEALLAERAGLLARWHALRAAADSAAAPRLLEAPASRVAPLFAEDSALPDEIRIADDRSFAELLGWTRRTRPELTARLLRDDGPAEAIEEGFAEALARPVPLEGGARLIIEHAAAATLIDVDLGGAASGRGAAHDTLVAVNEAAARAAARHIRLRALAGPIVIDFVSMRGKAARARVADTLAQHLAADSEATQLLGWTRLGHFELTRRRRRVPLHEALLEPAEAGGWHPRAETTALAALRGGAREARRATTLELRVAPEIAAALAGRLAAAVDEFREIYGFRPLITADPGVAREAFELRRP
jgi:ribonuclease G